MAELHLHLEEGGMEWLQNINRPQRNPKNMNTIEVMKNTIAEDTMAVVNLSCALTSVCMYLYVYVQTSVNEFKPHIY